MCHNQDTVNLNDVQIAEQQFAKIPSLLGTCTFPVMTMPKMV